jgi:pilus assembly protein Flp/PilA
MFRKFLGDNRGATAIEYALVGVIISLVVIAGAGSIGTTLSGTYNTVAANLR